MCRRSLRGPKSNPGLLQVMEGLDEVLPKGVKLHLFGVKSQGLLHLGNHPRLYSVDSMAWNSASRDEALKEDKSCTNEVKVRHMARWYERQLSLLKSAKAYQGFLQQLGLLLGW